MRFILFFLLFVSLFFAYTDPPFESVKSNNTDAIFGLRSKLISLGPLNEPEMSDPVIYANAKPIAVIPSVDDRVSSNKAPQVIWAWAENHADTIIDEWDDDGCENRIELNFQNFSILGTMSFSFKNNTKYTSFNENNDESSFLLNIPFTENELSKGNGSDLLNITISGEFTFSYIRDEHYSWPDGNGSCETDDESKFKTFKKYFSSSISYKVESGNVSFFLLAPVLREQWYRNNKFNTIAFSKRKFYKANITLNGEPISYAYLYSFDVYKDEYGIRHITSVENKSGNIETYEGLLNTSVNSLQKSDEPQLYAYMFNSSYGGVGWNTLKIKIDDHFTDSYFNEENILSRKLSFDGKTTEDGESYMEEDVYVRPSLLFMSDELKPVVASIGLLGVLILVVLNRTRIR